MWDLTDRTRISTLDLVASDFAYKSPYSPKPGGKPSIGEILESFPDSEGSAEQAFPRELLFPMWALPLSAYDDSNLSSNGTARFLDWELRAIVDTPEDGFGAMLFKSKTANPSTGKYEYIFAFRGTDGTDPIDWWQNLDLAKDVWANHQLAILGLLNGVGLAVRPADGIVHFTGQSLGGGLAQYAAYAYFLALKNSGAFAPSKLSLTTFRRKR